MTEIGRVARVRLLVVMIAAALAASCAGAPQGTAADPPLPCGSKRTIAYASYPNVEPNLTSLDVYAPPAGDRGCTRRPMVVWVHGGGWTSGDKSEYMADKAALFNGAGYVFASVNYRLTDKTSVPPAPQHPVHDQDTADAVAWLIHHAEDIGADPDHVALFGHSAGGGITAAVVTDATYLGQRGLPLAAVDCAGSMDGEGYDIVAGATTAPPEVQVGYRNAFGPDPTVWDQASPIRHVAPNTGIPAFFVAARGSDWRFAQHLAFIAALRSAGVPTTVLDATALEHADLTTQIGSPGDTVVTPALMSFLTGCFGPA
jgi:arylformamidase